MAVYTKLCNELRKALLPQELSPTAAPYVHTPLRPNSQTIRLAFLYPGKDKDPLRCSFAELPFEAAPEYTALSYTWGDPGIVSKVWIGGSPLGIGASLEGAMTKLRHETQFKPLWIDAICINQADNAEKSKQILLMRDIYQRATRVAIYLGENAGDSAMLPGLFESIFEACAKWGSFDSPSRPIPPSAYERLGLPARDNKAWETLRLFFERPWFRRVWIIQEFVTSSAGEFICGSWRLGIRRFGAIMMAIDLADLPALIPTSVETSRSVDLVWFMLAARRRDDLEGQGKKKLITLLHECRVANATDPKDYCFGLLGLSVEAQDDALRPDYSRSVAEVYRQYATYFVEHGDGINMLHDAGGTDCQEENLPSWVPNWARRDFVEPRLCPSPHTSYVKPLAYHAGTFFKPCVSIDDYNPDILKVKGVLFDEIAFLGSACEMNPNLDVSHLTLESDRNVAPTMHLVANCVLELRHMLRRNGRS